MTPRQLTDLFNAMNLGDKTKPGTLRHLLNLTSNTATKMEQYTTKGPTVSALCKYYAAPGRFAALWESLNLAEQKIISLHVWSNGSEPGEYADEIAKEFGIPKQQEKKNNYYYYYERSGLSRYRNIYAGKKSKLWLLFPEGGSLGPFAEELRATVGEMPRTYSKVNTKLPFFTREDRMADFARIVRYCNVNTLSLTKNGVLTKSAALKLKDYCGYEEYAADFKSEPADMRTTDGLLVTFPLFTLCVAGGLLAASENKCILGAKALSSINLPDPQLIQKLFEAYLKSKSFDEISLLKGLKTKRGHNPADARQNIARELKYCPVGETVATKELERHLRIAERYFARKDESYVTEGGSYYSYEIGWEGYERPLINIILTFFGALGILDLIWGEYKTSSTDESYYYDDYYGKRIPLAFRINPLGAYVLGLADDYTVVSAEPAKPPGGFTVLPDYTLIVPESADRLKHEIYFERLFTKLSATAEASIFKLDFETIVRTLNSGMAIDDLQHYLSASDKPLPENVLRALEDWKKQAGRIRLRQVTILECDDEALLEEVIRYRGMGELVREKIIAGAVVDADATSKIKKIVEKNKRFCQDVI